VAGEHVAGPHVYGGNAELCRHETQIGAAEERLDRKRPAERPTAGHERRFDERVVRQRFSVCADLTSARRGPSRADRTQPRWLLPVRPTLTRRVAAIRVAYFVIFGSAAGGEMSTEPGIASVPDDELRSVRGGKSFWSRVKGAAKWCKDHVVGGAKWIGLKFRF
jgi:hypothetical protein